MTMNSYMEYTVKAGIALTVLYLFYWLLMRKDTHFYLNRFVLVFSVIISLVIPSIRMAQAYIPAVFENLPTLVIDFSKAETSSLAVPTVPVATNVSGVNYWNIIFIIYIIGASIVFCRLIYQAIFLHAVARLSKNVEYQGYTIVYMNNDMTPFSYFNRIFIPAGHVDETSFDSIIAHEKSHLTQGHYIDLFIVEIMTVLQWFNPVMWFYEKSIKEVHEYLADDAVLHKGSNQGKYQALLVNQAIGGPVFILTNQFNQSLIKKRIMMMKKMKTSQLAKFKALLILPLIAALIMAFVNPSAKMQSATQGNETTVTGSLSDKLTGSALPGTVVIIKGTNIGTVADKQGDYSIKVADDKAVLVFSHVGYKTEEIPIAKNAIINVQLEVDAMVVDFNKEKSVNVNVNASNAQNNANDSKDTYQIVEELPSYKGGTQALQKFLEDNLRYPEEAKKAGIEGKVYVNFVVNAEGRVIEAKIMRSVSPLLNEEALRLTNSMKDWEPGSQHGEKLSMAVTMPIEFKIK
jgi:TonB family protein